MKIIRIERIPDREQTERESMPPWLVSFTDMTSILLAFFILLFASVTPREQPWVQASQSMRARFGGDASITQMTGQLGEKDSDKSWSSVDQDPGLDLTYLYSIVKKQLASDPNLAGVSLWKGLDNVVISFPADLSFKPGSDEISDQGRRIAAALAPFLGKLSNAVELIGYTDPTMVNTDGRFGSNWQLSLARAYAVSKALNDAGYTASIAVRGRGTIDSDLLPKNLPDETRNGLARRVDLRLYLQQP